MVKDQQNEARYIRTIYQSVHGPVKYSSIDFNVDIQTFGNAIRTIQSRADLVPATIL